MKKANLFCFAIMTPFLIISCASTPYTTTFTEIDVLIESGAWEIAEVLPQEESKTLAVYYFTEGDKKSSISDYLINGLTTQIANAIKYEEINTKVVSRQHLDRIMEELSFQMSDLADQTVQLKIGKQLGADLIVTGTVEQIAGEHKVNAQVIEVETGVVYGGFLFTLTR